MIMPPHDATGPLVSQALLLLDSCDSMRVAQHHACEQHDRSLSATAPRMQGLITLRSLSKCHCQTRAALPMALCTRKRHDTLSRALQRASMFAGQNFATRVILVQPDWQGLDD